MSYRHSSYRKMCRAVATANNATAVGERPDLTRAEMNRVLHWSGQRPLPKPPGWGKPKGAVSPPGGPRGARARLSER